MAGLSASEVAILLKAQDQASPVIQKVSGELGKLGDQGSGLGSKLASAGQALAGLATTAAVGGIAAIGAGFAAAVSAGGDFEKQMSAIAAVSGASASELASLQQAALDLGAKTSFSASEAAEGIEELVKAGVSIADILGGGAAAALDLAAAGGVKVSEAAELASNAMNVFGLKGADMAHVADVIAGAANASAISVTEYRYALAASGAVAKTVGVNFEDLSTAIALMGNAGIKGSDAGTSLKTMLMNLSPTSNRAKDAFRALGIITKDGANQFFDATGKAKSLAEIAGVLQQATKDLTAEQKLNFLEMMFGSDAIRAAAVMAEAGAEGFRELAGEIGKVTAQQVAAKRLDNLWGALEQLKGSAETAAIAVGLKLMPGLTQLTQWATEKLNAAIPMLESFADTTVSAIETVINIIRDMRAVFAGDLEGNAFTLDAIFPPGAADAITNGIRQIGDAWRTVIQVFTEGWEPSDTIDPFVNAVGQIALVFRDQVIPAITEVAGFIVEQLGTVVSWVQENWPLIAEVNSNVVKMLSDEWGQSGSSLPNVVRTAWEAIKTVISTELAVILGLTKANLQILNGDWAGAWQTLQEVVATTTKATEDLLYLFFGGTIAAMQEWAANALAAVTAWGEGILTSITGSLNAVGQALTDGWDAATATVTGAMEGIQAAIKAVWDQIPEDIRADVELILTTLTERGAAWVTSVTQTGAQMLTAVQTWLAQIVEAVTTWATSTMLEPLQSLTTSATDEAGNTGRGMWQAFTTWLSTVIQSVRTFAQQFVEPLRSLVSQVTTIAQDIGRAISEGIARGITSAAGAIRDAALEAARTALNAAKLLLGVRSPSTVFKEQVGLPIMQGWAEGIKDGAGLLTRALEQIAAPTPSLALAAVPTSAPVRAAAPTESYGGDTYNFYGVVPETVLSEAEYRRSTNASLRGTRRW